MNQEDFEHIIESQVQTCMSMLVSKNDAYSNFNEDKLRAFKMSAHLENKSLRQALGGMMAKHTISIYDMINDENEFSMEVWTEKITDHINYLLLLKAVLAEEANENTNQAVLEFIR